jgi:acetyl-CoA carboxylase carboxyltransferase component
VAGIINDSLSAFAVKLVYAPAITQPVMNFLKSPVSGVVVDILVANDAVVQPGQVLLVLESMKMEHEIRAPFSAKVNELSLQIGAIVEQGGVLLVLDSTGAALAQAIPRSTKEWAIEVGVRADLQQVLNRHLPTMDSARPEAMAKRHLLGMRSARENIADLCDLDTFIEFGALAIAAQSNRRTKEDLIANTPADGIVTGIGKVQGIQCVVLAYDMTVLAGTQGMRSHQKTDRILSIALERKWPVILFAEGGGGRPGDTDMPIIAGLNVATFSTFANLSGQVPLIGIVAGRCFAGNAALLGCCDVIIATKNSNIGMGGPAMVLGGGLGAFTPEQIGPSNIQFANGVIDVLVDDEVQAVSVTKRYLALVTLQKLLTSSVEQTLLRKIVPENRLRSYPVRDVIQTLFDTNSVLELKAGFGQGIVTAMARLNGHPIAVIANNPMHLGGAIDPDGAYKLNMFLTLANRQQLPIVSLVDTPGFMVGPDIEARAQIRYASQLFVVAAKITVPFVAVVLRKGYGLGAMAMTAGGFHQTSATVAWPTAEFGAMGLEGAVRLGYRKELEALDGQARDDLFNALLAKQYEQARAIPMAQTLEIDAVIDPAATRSWITSALNLNAQINQ